MNLKTGRPVGRPSKSKAPKRPGPGRPPKYGPPEPKRPVGRPRKYYTPEDITQMNREAHQRQRERNVEGYLARTRRASLKRTYGITPEQKETMWLTQNKKCVICNTSINLWCDEGLPCANVDHNHETGQVRDLLCGPCNTLVGFLEHDRLDDGLAYLDRWSRDIKELA